MTDVTFDHASLHARSLDDPEGFWLEAASGVDWITRPKRALDASSAPLYRWFPDARLNTCYNALDRHVIAGRADQPALIHDSAVTGTSRTYTYAELLDEVGADRDVPAAPQDNDPLELPVDPIFRVGSMSAAWNPTTQLLSIECHDLEHEVGASDETDGEQTTLRVVMTPSVAREFFRRSIALVAQGRRPCPLCNEPLDPSGHVCPRANGYRRR